MLKLCSYVGYNFIPHRHMRGLLFTIILGIPVLIGLGVLATRKTREYKQKVLTETHLNRIRFAVSAKIDLIKDPSIKDSTLLRHCSRMKSLLAGAYRSCIIKCDRDLIYLRGSAGLVKNNVILLHTNSKAMRSFYQRTFKEFSSVHFE